MHSRHRHARPVSPGLRGVFSPVTLLFAVGVGVITAVAWGPLRFHDDWASLWIAGEIVRDGRTDILYDIAPGDFGTWGSDVASGYVLGNEEFSYPHPFVHIPGVAFLMSVVVRVITLGASHVIVNWCLGFSLVTLVASAFRLFFRRPITLAVLAPATLLAWVSAVFQSSISLGQTSPMVFAGVAYALAASRTRPTLAGVILGLVAALKLTPLALIVVFLFFPARRTAGVIAAGTTTIAAILSIAVGGWALFREWLGMLHSLSQTAPVSFINQSLASVLLADEATETGADGRPVIVSLVSDIPGWLPLLTLAITAALLLVTVLAALRNRKHGFAIICVGGFGTAILTAKILWTHYLLYLVLPVVGIAALTPRRARGPVATLTCAALLLWYRPFDHDTGFFPDWMGLVSFAIVLLTFLGVAAATTTRGREIEQALRPLARLRRRRPPATP